MPGCGKTWGRARYRTAPGNDWKSKARIEVGQRYCKVFCMSCRRDITIKCCKNCGTKVNESRKQAGNVKFNNVFIQKDEMLCGKRECPRCKGQKPEECLQCCTMYRVNQKGTGKKEGRVDVKGNETAFPGTIWHETLYYVPCPDLCCPFAAVYKKHKENQYDWDVLAQELEAVNCTQCSGTGREGGSELGLLYRRRRPSNDPYNGDDKCSACCGTGRGSCTQCNGKGCVTKDSEKTQTLSPPSSSSSASSSSSSSCKVYRPPRIPLK